ncbi:MAG TPA: glycosyltransferase family 39 protein [Pirellulales bacterium]|nr:glycosyltransferase family 39 protein [Pirellulales bacterium]
MDAAISPPESARRAWRLEPQLGLLVLLVLGVYFPRLGDLTLRGEETRRARVAIEMLESGDYIVPREQGRLFPDRPPLGNWAIALSMKALGSRGAVAVRLPTVLATLITALVIYGYSRTFLTAFGALASGAAYVTMGQVLQLGFLAETEAMLTLFIGASLLVWHWGYSQGWRPLATWTAGYSLAALAALAKGPQGPVYFGGAVVVYLALRRDWRYLFQWAHLAGIAAFGLIVGAWQVPYSLEIEWEKVLQTWGHTSAARFDYSNPWPVIGHLLGYPWEIVGCLLPWSPWLAAFVKRDFRRSLGSAREPAIFLAVAILTAFPTCWLAPQARGRYFMPLYPCFAPLIGLVIDRASAAARSASLARMWQVYFTAAAAVLTLTGLLVLGVSVSGEWNETPLSQPLGFATVYGALAGWAAAAAWKARRGDQPRYAVAAVFAVAAFLGLTFNGLVMNNLIRRSEDVAGQVAELKRRLPPDARLISFGRAHHPFVYHYGQTIPWLDWPRQADDRSATADFDYFCFHSVRGRRKPLPFEWEEVDVISCDRYRRENPVDAMVVGRRINRRAANVAGVAVEQRAERQ